MVPRPRRPFARLLAVLVAVAAAATLAGCTPTVALQPASGANDPGCASIIVRLPDTVAGKKQDHTNAQATGAWGDPVAVQLRCGVAPLGPTTKPCVTVKTAGTSIDWVLETNPLATTLIYITFGRVPATEVVIKHGKNGVSDSTALDDLAQAVASVPPSKTEKCVGTSDAP